MTDKEGRAREIRQALARGYCYPKNASKVPDWDLVESMENEVLILVTEARKEAFEEIAHSLPDLFNKELCGQWSNPNGTDDSYMLSDKLTISIKKIAAAIRREGEKEKI